MSDYSVSTTWQMPGGGAPLTDHLAAADRLTDELDSHDGVVSVGPREWGAIISVSAPDVVSAVTSAAAVLRAACAGAGLPTWELVEARAVRADVFDEENSRPDLPELVGVDELVDVLEVESRQHAHQLTQEDPRFPAPLYPRNPGPLWDLAAILEFKAAWGRRPGRPPTS